MHNELMTIALVMTALIFNLYYIQIHPTHFSLFCKLRKKKKLKQIFKLCYASFIYALCKKNTSTNVYIYIFISAEVGNPALLDNVFFFSLWDICNNIQVGVEFSPLGN